jgi:uncharacterized protein (DUF302 family)
MMQQWRVLLSVVHAPATIRAYERASNGSAKEGWMALGTDIRLEKDFETALGEVTDALAAEGFGVISRVDLDRAFAEKLGKAFRRYTILGACNPGLAHAALSAVPEVGLLLPCNVTLEEEEGGTRVRLVKPEAMLGAMGAEAAPLADLMADAALRLGAVAERLGARGMD